MSKIPMCLLLFGMLKIFS